MVAIVFIMAQLKVVLIQGGLRQGAHSFAMLEYVGVVLKKLDAEVELIDLREDVLPLYNPGTASDDPTYLKIKPLIDSADCYVLATPDYHGTPSGAIKNILDFFWREFTGKLFGYICASHEKGLLPMETLRVAVRQCYGWSMPYGVSGGGDKLDFDEDGNLQSERLRQRLEMLSHDLFNYGKVIKQQRVTDIGQTHPSFVGVLRKKG